MRAKFSGHFRPDSQEFVDLWNSCIFAVDANVLLNLYRYSPATRSALENALDAVKDQLFVPHQAAKEFLKNRLIVTTGQAEEYTKAITAINNLSSSLGNRKKHPFLQESELPSFNLQVKSLIAHLEEQKNTLLGRLTQDEILEYVERTFSGKTGDAFDKKILDELVAEGEDRYKNETPPGYRDSKKDISDDPYRRYGDLIVWKQLLHEAITKEKSIVFITDDKKDDWWLEQAGRTIGPRPELREEFIKTVNKNFWMYTVDKFIEETARLSKTNVSQQVISEILEVREEINQRRENAEYPNPWKAISKKEMLERIGASERWAEANTDGFLGLKSFVLNYLGNAGYDHSSSYDMIRQLEEEGLIEVYSHQGEGHIRPAKAIRLNKNQKLAPHNRPFEALSDLISTHKTQSS